MAGSSCEPEVAQKKAGQLSSIVSVTKEIQCRAYIRPFYQQVYMPLDGNFIPVHLRRAMEWWHDYLALRPETYYSATNVQRQPVLWTDAASTRWVCAVFKWTRWLVPEWLETQLIERDDHHIVFTEMLAVIIGFSTFADLAKDTMATCYIDNQGVLHAIKSGACRHPEVSLSVARLWLDMVKSQTGLYVARVESRANIADGPTSEIFTFMQSFGAAFVEPVFPEWLRDVWAFSDLSAVD